MNTGLEIKEDGTIWLIVDCPVEPTAPVRHMVLETQDEYQSNLDSAQRLRVSNQEEVYAMTINDRGDFLIKTKPGIYPIPNLKWEEKRSPHDFKTVAEKINACSHPKCDCVIGRDGEENCNPALAVISLPESKEHQKNLPLIEIMKEESQEELWETLQEMLPGGYLHKTHIPELMQLFTITRKP